MKASSLNILENKISYFDINPEETKTLLFIHGNSMSKELFVNQLRSPVFKGYRLIALDLPGFGESSRSQQPSAEYNVPFYAEFIHHIIEALHLEKFYLIGHSLGGHIAIEYAGRYKNGLNGIIAVGTPPLGIPPDIPSAFLPNPAANMLFQAKLEQEEAIQLSKEMAPEVFQKEVLAAIQSADPLAREEIGKSIAEQNYLDEITVLEQTEVPYALFIGGKDAFCNRDYFKKYAFENQWRGKVNVIENASHNPFLNHSEEINTLIVEFLSDNQ